MSRYERISLLALRIQQVCHKLKETDQPAEINEYELILESLIDELNNNR